MKPWWLQIEMTRPPRSPSTSNNRFSRRNNRTSRFRSHAPCLLILSPPDPLLVLHLLHGHSTGSIRSISWIHRIPQSDPSDLSVGFIGSLSRISQSDPSDPSVGSLGSLNGIPRIPQSDPSDPSDPSSSSSSSPLSSASSAGRKWPSMTSRLTWATTSAPTYAPQTARASS
jgi:hypothetical protein